MKPVATVLMPVYNGQRYLSEAVQSVLDQSFRDFEFLIIDDGSTDATAQILERYRDARIRVLKNDPNLGLVKTLNRGLSEARGEWVVRMDADDWSHPKRFERQIGFLQSNAAIPVVGSDAILIDTHGRFAGQWRTGGSSALVCWDLCFRTPFAHSSVAFRRETIFGRYGGYRDCYATEDLDLWSRIGRELPMVTLRAPLIRYRVHAASIMGAENESAARASHVPLRSILQQNLDVFAPALQLHERDAILGVWVERQWPEDWERYFEALGQLCRMYARGRALSRGFSKLLADQNYMLWCRLPHVERGRWLRALRKADGWVFMQLPWLRMLAAQLMK